jgi:gluconolactonase
MEHFGVPRPPQLDFNGVYRLAPDGKALTLLAADFAHPNGLCFALDEKILFVSDTDRQHIRAFDVAPDGALANSRVWAETRGEGPGAPDGMKLDSAGNLFCCGPGGIHVFAPDATSLGVVTVRCRKLPPTSVGATMISRACSSPLPPPFTACASIPPR